MRQAAQQHQMSEEGRRQVSAPRWACVGGRWAKLVVGASAWAAAKSASGRPPLAGCLPALVLGDNQAGRKKIERFLSILTPYVTTYITPGSLKTAVRYLNPFWGAKAR